MSTDKVDTVLSFRSVGRSAIGRDRIQLLEAVASHGSITKAAHVVGMSYKTAWDSIDAMNNLLPRPAVVAQTGGRQGGGAIVTDDGLALIAAFHLLEKRLARATALLTDSESPVDPLSLLWSLGMKTSARNAFRCKVAEVRQDTVSVEVILSLTDTVSLAATITAESASDLQIVTGAEVTALIKAPFILLATGKTAPQISTRNCIPGVVVRREDGAVNSEIIVDIGGGKRLIANISRESAEKLQLAAESPVWAMFKSSDIILAIE